MEVRRAMFLRARNQNPEKMAYPVALERLFRCVELGTSVFSKWHIELTKESGRNRRYLQKVVM